MAKRGRPPNPHPEIETIISEHLSDIEKKELSRLALLYVDIFIEAHNKIIEFNATEDEKNKVIKAAEKALNDASKTVYANLKDSGISILTVGRGRPTSLDATLRACFTDHLKRQGKSLTFAFNMLTEDIKKIPAEFGIKYPVSKTTHQNHWRQYEKQKRSIAIIQFLQASIIVWMKDKIT